MSRPAERGTGGSGTAPLTATRRMYRAGTDTALTMQTAVGRAALAASRIAARQQFAWTGATTGALDAARHAADAEADAAEAIAATIGLTAEPDEAPDRARAVESTGEATAELADAHAASASTFDRFLDAAAPFGHPDDGDGR